ncbi:MAG: zf-TFIIB domain-containing protein [Leifsonia sp.]
MRCPTDNVPLVMSERSGVEIDYCPECRGVWLDRGELDKIIERAGSVAAAPQSYARQEYGRQEYGRQPSRKKRENWLSELFD